MKPNRIKAMIGQGLPTVGSWVATGSPAVAEVMGLAGFDWLLVDCEHGPTSFEQAQCIMQAFSSTDATPFLRVADNNPALIKRALDIGAMGVIVPMVNTKAAAEQAVRACKYPPQGIRGIAAARAHLYGFDFEDYMARANDEIMVVVQIEHRDAVSNIEEIVTVEGIDVLFIGPADLSGSFGYTSLGGGLPAEVSQAIDHVVAVAQRARVALGMWVPNAEVTNMRIAQGFRFLGLNADHLFLGDTCRAALKQVKRPAG